MPAWLAGHVAGGRVDIGGFLGSRLVYYPGSGIDGHPLRVFGASHSAHCFVFADNGLNRDDWIVPIREQGRRGVRGYRLLDVQDLSIDQLVPYGYRPGHPSLSLLDFDGKGRRSLRMVTRCAPLCVLERMAGFHEGHGPRRLAILCWAVTPIRCTTFSSAARDGRPLPCSCRITDGGETGVDLAWVECLRASPGEPTCFRIGCSVDAMAPCGRDTSVYRACADPSAGCICRSANSGAGPDRPLSYGSRRFRNSRLAATAGSCSSSSSWVQCSKLSLIHI